ncbi:hypothetical protein ACFLU5_03535 [Bacteroidota bacterium]
MKIVEVANKKTVRDFLYLPLKIYKNEQCWIRPLDRDIESTFNPSKNKHFRNGECIRWLLIKDTGEVIGRIAAFINEKTVNKGNDQPTGGIGFFECINDQDAANTLFDQSKTWLEEKGIEAMDGPINFGDRNEWWGLLVDGYDREPNYKSAYNPPYYRELFENYGFQVYYKQFTYARKVMDPLSEKLHIKADQIRKNPKYRFEYLDINKLEKYTEYLREVYNKAWAGHKNVPKLTLPQAKTVIKQMKPIIDPKILYFGFYEDEPVAIFIMIPEMNQVFKYVNGKMNLLGILKFLYHHKIAKTNRKMLGIIFGIVPEHQGKGVDGAIIMASRDVVQETYLRYEDFEMNWIGDFNPKMTRIVEQVGSYLAKTHITYRYLFDRKKEFKRHPMVNV